MLPPWFSFLGEGSVSGHGSPLIPVYALRQNRCSPCRYGAAVPHTFVLTPAGNRAIIGEQFEKNCNMGPWLSWESAAFASRRPRVRIPSGPPNKKDACRRLFYLVDLGEHRLFANSMTTALIKRDGGTRKRFPHHTAPSLAVEQAFAPWRNFYGEAWGGLCISLSPSKAASRFPGEMRYN